MTAVEAYLGLGGNIGDTHHILLQALNRIEALPGVSDLECAPFYRSSPVSDIPQDPYINTVCRVRVTTDYHPLMEGIQSIEKDYGRDRSQKNAPRVLDIDLLFFGTQSIDEGDLTVPHPRWRERLFVLVPLADLTSQIVLPDGSCVQLTRMIEEFPDAEQQWIEQESRNSNSLAGRA